MNKKMSYQWNLRKVMATRDLFATTDLVPLLADRGIHLSREQVFRLVTTTPQRLSLDTHLGTEDQHVIELWQDERPEHGLDIGLWFGQLYVLGRELNPVTPAMITAWRQRWSDAAIATAGPGKGVSVNIPHGRPQLDLALVLARTSPA